MAKRHGKVKAKSRSQKFKNRKAGSVQGVADRSPRNAGKDTQGSRGERPDKILSRRVEARIYRTRTTPVKHGSRIVPPEVVDLRDEWLDFQVAAMEAFMTKDKITANRLYGLAGGIEERIYAECCVAGVPEYNLRKLVIGD